MLLEQMQQVRYTDRMATNTENRSVTVRVSEESRDFLNSVAALRKTSIAAIIEPFAKEQYLIALADAARDAEEQADSDRRQIAATNEANWKRTDDLQAAEQGKTTDKTPKQAG